MGFLRSETMFLYKFAVSKDNAWYAFNDLGQIQSTMIIDMNKQMQIFELPYIDMVSRAEDAIRKLKYIQNECKFYDVKLISPQKVLDVEKSIQVYSRIKKMAPFMIFDHIEQEIKEKEQFILAQDERIKSMHEGLNELIEYEDVLRKTNEIIHGQEGYRVSMMLQQRGIDISELHEEEKVFEELKGEQNDSDDDQNIRQVDEIKARQLLNMSGRADSQGSFRDVSITYIAGTIDVGDVLSFRRLLFRSTRGKVLVYFKNSDVQIKDFQGSKMHRVIYIIVFQEGYHFKDKLQKICDSFNGKRFQLPDNGHGDRKVFNNKVQKVIEKIQEVRGIIKTTKEQMRQYLEKINQQDEISFSLMEVYRLYLLKEQGIYSMMNKMQTEGNIYTGYLWSHLQKHQIFYEIDKYYRQINEQELQEFQYKSQSQMQLEEVPINKVTPPTFFRDNEFTYPFQLIVNTYGIPSYKEFNPAVLTCITFPFLFAVMYGDVGHGLVLFLFSAFLCLFKTIILQFIPFLKPLLPHRYSFLLMGFFAIYCGLIYNDFLSIPLQVGDTCYDIKTRKLKSDCTYKFGIDYIWFMSKKELQFINSLKMKLSVIFAVMQMLTGIIIRGLNEKYFKRKIEFIHIVIPQLIIMIILIGYMDILILGKWLTNFENHEHNAPSIITIMIEIFLNGGVSRNGYYLYNGQQAMANLILVILFLCIPWMLLVTPLIKKRNLKDHKKEQNSEIELKIMGNQENYQDFVEEHSDSEEIEGQHNKIFKQRLMSNEDQVIQAMGQYSDDKHSFADLMVHQLIETIEFVLGAISNTASYLRLWALSLAHQELSIVFFNNTVKTALQQNSTLLLIVSTPIFFSVTLFILMFMDTLECFLHTLRLHWVEFQNKFYEGKGYLFKPFSIRITMFEQLN